MVMRFKFAMHHSRTLVLHHQWTLR